MKCPIVLTGMVVLLRRGAALTARALGMAGVANKASAQNKLYPLTASIVS